MKNDIQWGKLVPDVENPENLVVAFGSATDSFKICSASDNPVGVILSKASIEIPSTTAGQPSTFVDRVQVQLFSSLVKLVTDEEIDIGDNIYAAADGKVSDSGTKLIGRSINSTGESGGYILVATIA